MWPLVRVLLDWALVNGALLFAFGVLYWLYQGLALYRRLRDRWRQPVFHPVRQVYAHVEHRAHSPTGAFIPGTDPADVAERLLARGRLL